MQGGATTLKLKRLESKVNDENLLDTEYNKILISNDHVIVLNSEEVYTFHLKELYWSKHRIEIEPGSAFMSSKSCLARHGLIVDLEDDLVLKLLIFDTEEVPKNFSQKSEQLNNSINFNQSSFSISANSKSIVIFGGQIPRNRSCDPLCFSNTLYQVDLESYEIIELEVDGPKPHARDDCLTAISNDKMFLFGGVDQNLKDSRDLWVFNLSEMKWKQLTSIPSKYDSKYFKFLLSREGEIYLSRYSDCEEVSIFGYNMSEDSWREVISKVPDSEGGVAFAFYGDFLIFANNDDIYSSNIFQQRKTCKQIQSEDFVSKLYGDATFADVIFQVEGQEFPANKCIVSARCSHFKNAFTSNMMESQSKMIPIKNVPAKLFKAILQHIYFLDVEIEGESAEDLFKLAHEYGLEALKNDCEELLTRDLRVKNVINRIHFAKTYEAMRLRKACLMFIVINLEEVIMKENIYELDRETHLELHRIKL